MAYEKFKHKRSDSCGIVTIHTAGVFRMNRILVKYFLDCSHAVLYFDREKNRIGFKPASKEDKSAFALCFRHYKGEASDIICASRSFFQHYNIDHSKGGKYEAKWNEKEKLVEINLNNPIRKEKMYAKAL